MTVKPSSGSTVASLLTLMVMIFAGGHISGAHFNPAVTLAVFLRGKCPAADVVPYWVAQIAGAAVAAGAVMFVKGASTAPPLDPVVDKALVVEFLYTFALAYVVLNVATAKETAGNSYYGLAIGFTVLAGAYSVGAVSGGAFNPAVAVGITILKLVVPAKIWIYFLANLAAGAGAAFVFKFLHPGDE